MNKKSSLINGLSEISLTFAKSMAVACSARSQPSNEIGPLPGASYMASSLSATVIAAPWPLGMPEMVPGQWTLLIIHEMIYPVFKKPRGKPDKMRCAPVSPISNDGPLVQPGEARYQVLDMETFLANVRHSSTSEAR